jgi:hypothetical protein
MTVNVRKDLQWPVLALVLGGASVWLAAAARGTVTSFHQRTAHLCDGTIPLPSNAFVLTWAAVVAAVGAVVVAVVVFRRYRVLGCVLVLAGVLVLASAGWTTVDVHADAVPVARVCGG